MIRDYGDYVPTLKPFGDWLQSIGMLIITYNGAEAALREMAGRLCTLGQQGVRPLAVSQIVTLELGNQSLDLVLRTLANETLLKEEAACVSHAAEYVARLREYRNFFVHGLNGDVYVGPIGSGGLITVRSAKGSIKQHPKLVVKAELEELARHCWTARVYISDLNSYFDNWRLTYAERVSGLPHKPPLIDRMEKPSFRPRG